MRDALVFTSCNNLDFQDVRMNVLRIPEVAMRVREAQQIWDNLKGPHLDLTNFIASDDSGFLGNIRLKNFAVAVIQVGLLDRYLKRNNLPDYILGITNGDSPLKVALGRMSFFDMVSESAVLNPESPKLRAMAAGGDLPLLSGVQLAKYAAYKRGPMGAFEECESEAPYFEKLLQDVTAKNQIVQLIVIGPVGASNAKRLQEGAMNKVKVTDSVDADPLLGWFWNFQTTGNLSAAN